MLNLETWFYTLVFWMSKGAQWLAWLPHTSWNMLQVFSLGLHVWSLHVLPMCLWWGGDSGFPPQAKNMLRPIGIAKLPLGKCVLRWVVPCFVPIGSRPPRLWIWQAVIENWWMDVWNPEAKILSDIRTLEGSILAFWRPFLYEHVHTGAVNRIAVVFF